MKDNHRLEAQDWICMSCNNLNYSFRKVCNRCKVTTREDNQKYSQLQYYSIYYQSPYYPFQEDTNNSGTQYLSQTSPALRNCATEPRADHDQIERKNSGSEGSAISKWDLIDEEGMALLPNAWEGLKVCQEPLCSSSQSSAQHLAEDWDDQDVTLPNFDLTFL